jgi:hypothetical protein
MLNGQQIVDTCNNNAAQISISGRQNKHNYSNDRQGDLFWAQLMIIKWPRCSIFLLLLALRVCITPSAGQWAPLCLF